MATSLRSPELFVGCAGWSLRKDQFDLFPQRASHLQRYAAVMNAVEINSSFHRSHRRATYERWADNTPENFRFAVKSPKQITHISKLAGAEAELENFLLEIAGLREKLGPILVQLPPSLKLDVVVARRFFSATRQLFAGEMVCEPRHRTWFTAEADELLKEYDIARVAADPAILPAAAVPGGSPSVRYYRWHGSPRTYYSSYGDAQLSQLAAECLTTRTEDASAWCVFDNTASGAAVHNALALLRFCAPVNQRAI